MAMDFLEGLASTVNDVLDPLFDFALKTIHFFSLHKEKSPSLENTEPFR